MQILLIMENGDIEQLEFKDLLNLAHTLKSIENGDLQVVGIRHSRDKYVKLMSNGTWEII